MDKQKVFSSRNIKLIVLVALLIVLIVLIPIGYGLFSDKDKANNGTEIGRIEVQLKEDWPEYGETDPLNNEQYDEFGLDRSTKKVWGHLVGNLPAYVRVRCIPIIEYNTDKVNAEGDWVTAPVPQSAIAITIDAKNEQQVEKWVQSGDYWYYKDILVPENETPGTSETNPPKNDTSKMTISWQLNELPSELEGYKVRTDVRVILEYAQTTHNMWKDIFKINALPEGVQQ